MKTKQAAVLAAFALVLGLYIGEMNAHTAVAAEKKSLEKRVSDLEDQVSDLEIEVDNIRFSDW